MAEQNNNASSTEEVRLPPVNMRKFRIMSTWFVRFFFVLLFSCFILSLAVQLILSNGSVSVCNLYIYKQQPPGKNLCRAVSLLHYLS